MTLGIIGTGNMANQLLNAFTQVDIKLSGIYGRNKLAAEELSLKYNIPLVPKAESMVAEIIILCVSDEAIGEVSQQLENVDGIVVHTSGSTSLKNISAKNKGVFYPLQTMTKKSLVDFSEVPIFITAEEDSVSTKLQSLARAISHQVYAVNDDQRMKLHLAAVISNNFINHLTVKSKELLESNGLSYEMITPLLRATLTKLTSLPYNFEQTGPAKRRDLAVLAKHIELLKGDSNLCAIYGAISKSISEHEV